MFSQLAIALFGLTAIWLTQQKTIERRKWASVLGLMSQPFWFYATYKAEQWGIFTLTFCYSYVWAKGFYTHWLEAPSGGDR